MAIEGWAPIVYGRTLAADTWWRALPTELSRHGWLGDLVTALVAGGDQLDRPRFLLARVDQYRVVGVACMARELSLQYAADERRPLYTFVGWTTQLSDAVPPALADLEAHYPQWAAPLYQEWVGRDWTTHQSLAREPHPTDPASPPWPASQPAAAQSTHGRDEAIATSMLSSVRQQIEVWPASDRHELWEKGRGTASPFVLAVGWDNKRNVPRSTITHATAGDWSGPRPTHVVVASDPRTPTTPRKGSGSPPVRAPNQPGPAASQASRGYESPNQSYVPVWSEITAAGGYIGSAVDTVGKRLGLERLLPGEGKPAGQHENAAIQCRVEIYLVCGNEVLLFPHPPQKPRWRLPYGMLQPGETPWAVCHRVVRDFTGAEVSEAELVDTEYFASRRTIALRFRSHPTTDLDPALLRHGAALMPGANELLRAAKRQGSALGYRESQ
jgi:hypothetical protein